MIASPAFHVSRRKQSIGGGGATCPQGHTVVFRQHVAENVNHTELSSLHGHILIGKSPRLVPG